MDRFSQAVFESEDSDTEDGSDVLSFGTNMFCPNRLFPMAPEVMNDRWKRIDPEVRKTVGHMLHVSVFWWHILFRQQENSITTDWAVEVGFLDTNVSNDLSLKRLQKIEILELILDAMEILLAKPDTERRVKAVLSLSNDLQLHQQDCLSKVESWLGESGQPGLTMKLLELGSKKTRCRVLNFVFFEYSRYIHIMSHNEKMMMRELSQSPEEWSILRSEEMKNKGNIDFQKKKYDLALKWYTKAIKHHTNNHLLYGNRALCYIRCEKYLKAMGDGKRAIILQRDWAKGHYRFCDALFFMGARGKAVESNIAAQNVCSADSEGMKDLQQQYSRFQTELAELQSEGRASATSEGEKRQRKTGSKKGSNKQPEGACGLDPLAQNVPLHTAPDNDCTPAANKDAKAEDTKILQETSGPFAAQAEDGAKGANDAKISEMGDRKTKKLVPQASEKQSVRSKHHPTQEKSQGSGSSTEVGSKEQFCAAVQDAHTALTDQRCHNAEQAFCLALRILDSIGTKVLGISELDKALLIYGYATALIEIGKPEELSEAQKQLNKLNSSQDRTFKSLVHYGFGKVFLKENRFKDAKEEFSNALTMLRKQIMPGKLTWPTTKVTVKETQPDVLKDLLESFIQVCKFPPKPDANCRHQPCLGHANQIYFTDPDFRGFIQLSCSERCWVEFHINCWKKLKAASFPDKNDKDFLQSSCFTPDCTGKICHIIIFDSTGLKKCEFESSVPKSHNPGKLRVKQKCTSLKKIKSKENRKQRRKQKRAAESKLKDEVNELTPEENNSKQAENNVVQTSPRNRVLYGDRVLQQIYESRELFNDELHSISNMLVRLRPWMDLDEANGHESVLKDRAEPHVLRDLVDLLLERGNRVWARIFVHNLTDCKDIKPKLYEWAQQLDNTGLNIADKFISQCGEHLEEFDFSPLLKFPPLQDLSEKFGPMQELLGDPGFTLQDYLRQAAPQEMRLFVWALEEHRERYPSCFASLDEYFEMDAVCLVIKKTDFEDQLSSVYKSKGKHRKKKQKESKSILVLSGIGSIPRDEEDFFTEEDSLMFLNNTDPFSIPNHLREQVEEFEGRYVNTGGLPHYNRILDNHPDPAKESLYGYFEQILEEHGPLEASNPLLVGELDNFPPEAQNLIEVAGGLKPFLLGSLRFVRFDNLIGLMEHSVSLQHAVVDFVPLFDPFYPHTYGDDDLQPTEPSHLNPTAKEFLPHDISETIKPGLEGEEYPDHIPNVPLSFNSDDPGSNNNDVISYCEEFNYMEGRRSKRKTTFVQTVADSQDDVAINTEPFAPYEKNNGDFTLTEKNNIQMKKRIQNIQETREILQKERKDTCSELEDEVKQIREQAEIAKKELDMFQKMLEEEVQKGQQEKKDHQEMVKALKSENKELADQHDSYFKQIQEKNVAYQKELDDYLAKSNQSAAEKSSLEDEIKRCQNVLAKATGRSLAAQTCILQNKRELGLCGLRKYISDGKSTLQYMTEISTRVPHPGLLSNTDAWKACVQAAQERIRLTEMRYEEQLELLKKGTNLSSLPPVSVPSLPVSPPIPALPYPLSNQQPNSRQPHVQRSYTEPLYPAQQHPTRIRPQTTENLPPLKPAQRAMHTPPAADERAAAPASAVAPPVHPQPAAVFDKIIDRLSSMFPHYTRPILSRFIQEVRANNGGTLNMLTYEQIINRAAQLILDHQEHSQMNMLSGNGAGMRENVVPSPTPSLDSSRATPTPPPAHAWKSVSSHPRNSSKAKWTKCNGPP
ncbi:E3 ubiquitin-protein ligase TTC3 isoform X2 [Trichomycterus rosablanca]|uniref:E3 ubiquitin-protein ligase TTC3 isoform X2 n=1 Tax=Trichomycterus rosablanca TaxID=2290929 RepID=UPI002F35AD97